MGSWKGAASSAPHQPGGLEERVSGRSETRRKVIDKRWERILQLGSSSTSGNGAVWFFQKCGMVRFELSFIPISIYKTSYF